MIVFLRVIGRCLYIRFDVSCGLYQQKCSSTRVGGSLWRAGAITFVKQFAFTIACRAIIVIKELSCVVGSIFIAIAAVTAFAIGLKIL